MLHKKNIDFNNKEVFYCVVGTGTPVVLVHGFGEDSRIWRNQIEGLQDRFQLIIPDLPGSGQSEMIDEMSIEGMADVVKKILDAEAPSYSPGVRESNSQPLLKQADILKIQKQISGPEAQITPPLGELKRAVLIGHSMGGYITLAFAEKYSNLLKGFGLFHSTAYADNEEKKTTRLKGIEFIKKHGAVKFLQQTIPNLYSLETKENNYNLIEEHLKNVSYFTESSLITYYYYMMNRPDRTHVLKNSPVPVLFIAGKYDTAVPLLDVLEQTHMPDLAYIHIIESSSHIGMVEQPALSNKILKEFLENISL